jgi:hypothetical protein
MSLFSYFLCLSNVKAMLKSKINRKILDFMRLLFLQITIYTFFVPRVIAEKRKC